MGFKNLIRKGARSAGSATKNVAKNIVRNQKESFARERDIKSAAREAYLQEKKKESIRLAKERARLNSNLERDRLKLKASQIKKARRSPRRDDNFFLNS